MQNYVILKKHTGTCTCYRHKVPVQKLRKKPPRVHYVEVHTGICVRILQDPDPES